MSDKATRPTHSTIFFLKFAHDSGRMDSWAGKSSIAQNGGREKQQTGGCRIDDFLFESDHDCGRRKYCLTPLHLKIGMQYVIEPVSVGDNSI